MASTRSWSIAGRVFLLQLLAALVIAGGILVVLSVDARRAADVDAAALSQAVAETLAVDPDVLIALESEDPTQRLQPWALRIVEQDRVDFVTVMTPSGTRLTHPDPEQIGGQFAGTISAAQRGEVLTETYTGTLGPSVRAVVPILDSEAEVVGIVSAGVTTDRVAATILPRVPFVAGIAVLVVVVGSVGAWLTRRAVSSVTGRLSEDEMRQMVQFYESVLHSVREGVVLSDGERRILLYNDEAADLLGLPPAGADLPPATPSELGLSGDIAEVLLSGRRVVEEAHVAGDRVLLVNQEPAASPGRAPGTGPQSTVMTLRDQSRLQTLVGELESVRTLTDALRSQAHEHSNTLHTIVSLLELGRSEQAIELLSEATRTSQGLADAVLGTVADPVLGALLLGKSAQASERGVSFEVDIEPGVTLPLPAAGIVSVVGNLVDNALEAALAAPPPREVRVELRTGIGWAGTGSGAADPHIVLTVIDSGQGPDPAIGPGVFDFGVSSKAGDAHGIGLAVVRQVVSAHAGTVDFAETSPTTVVVRLPLGGGA